jgi:hypothetical protein
VTSLVPFDKLGTISIVAPAIWDMSLGMGSSNCGTLGPYLFNYFSFATLSIWNILWRAEIHRLASVIWKVVHSISLFS